MKSPVQVLVVGFDEPNFSGAALTELARLKDAGIVRLIDLLLVERTADGELQTLPGPDALGVDAGAVAASLLADASGAGGGHTDMDAEATWSLADVVPLGSTAVVALIEHLWAAPLVEAIGQAGGQMLEETWLADGDRGRLQELTSPHAVRVDLEAPDA